MKIGVIGSGIVGQTLANGFVKHGYEVMIGTNDPSKHDELKSKTAGKAKIGTFEETAKFGEAIVLAVKGVAAVEAVKSARLENLKGKLVFDTTNPIAQEPPVNGVLKYFTSLDESLMEQLQHQFSDVKFVKAWSCIGNAGMVNAEYDGIKPTMFICGNDDAAKKEASRILEQFGFDIADMGKVEAARAIEPLAILWCIPGFHNNQWTHAFKLLKK